MLITLSSVVARCGGICKNKFDFIVNNDFSPSRDNLALMVKTWYLEVLFKGWSLLILQRNQ